MFAQLMDIGVIIGIIFAIFQVAPKLALVMDETFLSGLIMFLVIATPFLYFILMEGLWNGRTIGKLACGLRVRMADGTPIRFSASVGRNLVRAGDFLPVLYFAGLLATFTTPKAQRFGDQVAGTVVIRDAKAIPRFSPAPHKAGVHPFEPYIGELRGMTDEEYIVLKRFCDRFPELAPHIQQKLVEEVWVPFAADKHISPIPNVHSLYLAEATVMKYGRMRGLL